MKKVIILILFCFIPLISFGIDDNIDVRNLFSCTFDAEDILCLDITKAEAFLKDPSIKFPLHSLIKYFDPNLKGCCYKNLVQEKYVYLKEENPYLVLMKRLLILKKIDINAQDDNGNTILHKAVAGFFSTSQQSNYDLIQLLIGKSADPFLKNDYDQTSIDIFLDDNYEDWKLLDILLQNSDTDEDFSSISFFTDFISLDMCIQEAYLNILMFLVDKLSIKLSKKDRKFAVKNLKSSLEKYIENRNRDLDCKKEFVTRLSILEFINGKLSKNISKKLWNKVVNALTSQY